MSVLASTVLVIGVILTVAVPVAGAWGWWKTVTYILRSRRIGPMMTAPLALAATLAAIVAVKPAMALVMSATLWATATLS